MISTFVLGAQTLLFKEAGKWGIKENEKTIIPALYDTVFNFDKDRKVCLACDKAKQTSSNKFLKSYNVSYNCCYLNYKAQRLIVKTETYDTIGIFSLQRNSVNQYQEDPEYIIASVKGRKFLVKKDFTQITKNDYSDILPGSVPEFFLVEVKTEGNQILKGLIDLEEKLIVPLVYSSIKFNTLDSLIVGCSAGLGNGREDDVYNYSGKKLASYKRHVDIAMKEHILHKIWEPKEQYILYNIATKEEKIVFCEEAKIYSATELLMRNENHWFTYELNTGKKKAYENKNLKKH